MEMISLHSGAGKPFGGYGSRELTITHLAKMGADGQIVAMHIGPGGKVGGHPADGWQIFIIISGSGEVCGGDRLAKPIQAGQAAVWAPGEWHETRSETGLIAVVIESEQFEFEKG